VRGATGRDGIVSEPKVADWAVEHAGANVALRADGWIGIDVDAYDGKIGDKTLAALEAELGELPVTISSTSRGQGQPSRIWFYRVPRGMHFVHNFPDLEVIQYGHRYAVVAPSIHPETGQPYAWYGYEGELLDEFPSIDDFEELPEAWLNRLAIPDDQNPRDLQGFSGSVKEWLERVPGGTPGLWIQEVINDIPKTDFGHDEMVSLQSRIVSQAAHGDTGAAQALEILKAEWLRDPYNTPEYRRDWDVSLRGAIEKFGALAPASADILKQDQVALFRKVGADGFLDLWTGVPEIPTPESLREQVEKVVHAALGSGLSALEAATLGWHSAAAQRDGGIRGGVADGDTSARDAALEEMWSLAKQVEERLMAEPVAQPEPSTEVDPAKPRRAVTLLLDEEREQALSTQWWGTEYMRVMRETHAVMSDEYYETLKWVALSLCFAHKAVIPSEEGYDIPLNFYVVIIGGSKTGKSRSIKPVQEIAKRFWLTSGDNPDIGGDATRAALTQALIRRDGLPTLFRADEADATIAAWKNSKGEFVGMAQAITDIYLGDVPPINRVTHKDISGIHAKAFLNVVLSGIDYRIADAIEPGDWETGFVNRFVIAKGERKARTRDQKKFRVRRSAGGNAQTQSLHHWYDQWAARFNRIASTVLMPAAGEKMVWIDFEDDVVERHTDAIERLEAIARASRYTERLDATFGRLEETILKCAALVAITRERKVVNMSDYLIALEQGEAWVNRIVELVSATDLSPRARQVNRLYELLASRQRWRVADLRREEQYAGDYRFLDGLIAELKAQGRIDTDRDAVWVLREGES